MSGSSAKAYRTGKLRQNICKYWSAFDEYSVDLITELETGRIQKLDRGGSVAERGVQSHYDIMEIVGFHGI